MKSHYKLSVYAGIVSAMLSALYLCINSIPTPDGRHLTTKQSGDLAISENTVADIRSAIQKQEYHISYDPQQKMLQSPNRGHNLRAYYEPGRLTVQTRVDTTGHRFKLELTNKRIYADGKPLYLPQPEAKAEHHDNYLQFKHDAFLEEFINSEQGIRQNFIIEDAPQAHAAIAGTTCSQRPGSCKRQK